MATNFQDASGEIRLVGTIYAPGATVGDVFTVQADGSLAPAPGGGSQPGALAWTNVKTFTFAEWNAGGVLDVVTLATGTLLYDATIRFSADFDDSYASAGGNFGWDLAGTPRRFGSAASLETVDDWSGVSGNTNAGPRSALGGVSVVFGLAVYGPPAFIKDSGVAGPLQFSPNSNGDATAGSVDIWLLTATLA